MAALITGSMTTAVTLGASPGTNGVDYVPWMWLDVALIAALGWGLYRRSRVAAGLMLLYFTAAKVLTVRRDLHGLDDPTWSDVAESLDTCVAGAGWWPWHSLRCMPWGSMARWCTGGSRRWPSRRRGRRH